jgi:hypothetical protein
MYTALKCLYTRVPDELGKWDFCDWNPKGKH